MSLNRILIILFGILILLSALTAIQFNRSKSGRVEFVTIDDEILATHIHCVPEIVRSFNNVKDVHGKNNTLFYRYTNNSCSSCLNYYLFELLALQEAIGKEHIWIFPAYPDDRGSRIQLSAELAKYNYRNIPADSLLIPHYNGEQKSYFGWINNDGELDMVFIPDIHNRQYTQKFFLEIQRKIK